MAVLKGIYNNKLLFKLPTLYLFSSCVLACVIIGGNRQNLFSYYLIFSGSYLLFYLCSSKIQMKNLALFLLTFLLFQQSFAQDIKRAKKVIDTLASSSMHGRGYVLGGDSIAANFIRGQYKSMGVLPIKNSYYQYFKFDINTFPKRVFFKADKKILVTGQDYIVNPVSGKGKGKAHVQVLDSLIFSDDSARKKFLASDLKHKAIVYKAVDYNRIIELPLDFLDKIHEAKCVIELQDKKLTASVASHQYSHPFFQVKKDAFEPTPHKVKFKLDAVLNKDYKSQNVIGYVEGKIQRDSMVVITAHYDHLGMMGKKAYFPGANDDASGVAMMLELAHYYSLPDNRPPYTMVFIAFSAEEAGLLGSLYYTEHPLFPLSRIKFLINLDLVGTGEDGITVVNGSLFTDQFNKLVKINGKNNYVTQVKKRGQAHNSDHFFFTERGVPSFFIYTMGGISAYHDIYDKPETLPLTKFSEVFHLIVDFIKEL